MAVVEVEQEESRSGLADFLDLLSDRIFGRDIRAEGKELCRHEGFLSKEDILKTWKKNGVDVTRGQRASNQKEAN